MNSPSSPFRRPDVVEIIGPEFDAAATQPAGRTLIICTAPRSGSSELCRHLMAAGIGAPHEYFHPYLAPRIGVRWGLGLNPLAEANLGRYIDALRRRRGQGGVFAVKLMYYQFQESLRNAHGAALFEGAQVVHLYRPDVASQFASLRAAMQTGQWDFSDRRMGQFTVSPEGKIVLSSERAKNGDSAFDQALRILTFLVNEDAGFRRLFALLGITPLFITSDEAFHNSRDVVQRIAEMLGAPLNETQLERSIAHGGAYNRGDRQRTMADLGASFNELAFRAR